MALYERTHVSSDAILRVVWGLPVGDVSGVKGARRVEEQPHTSTTTPMVMTTTGATTSSQATRGGGGALGACGM